MGVRIGIDLGTTYSAVARIDPGTRKPVVVPNSFGERSTASALAFGPDGTVLFGEEAKDEYHAGNPAAAAFYKRDMGNPTFRREIHGRSYTPTDLSAVFLRHLVADVEQVLGEPVESVVISVPAYFAHAQIKATQDAAAAAGLTLVCTIHEPTAAALAYGLDKADTEQTILFYDLGGGTFDVTIAKVARDGITVLGSDGDHRLGGKDWDDAITRHLLGVVAAEHGVDATDAGLRETIAGRAESLKRQLTAKASVTVPVVADGRRIPLELTQEEFVQLGASLCERTVDIIEVLFEDLGLGWSDIDHVILVGGSTKMPMIRTHLERLTRTPVVRGVNVDEAVSLGAAIRANAGGQFSGEVLQLGAAPGRDASGVTLLLPGFTVTEVVAHALGMIAVNEAGDGYVNSVILRKNTTVPAHATRIHAFRADARNREMEIFVLQGDFPRPLDNTVVHKYVATEIDPRGSDRIEVTYSYDHDGLVVVSARQDGRVLPVRIDQVPEDMSWTDRPPRAPLATGVTLALDLSGSMSGEPLQRAKQAMRDDFVGALGDLGIEVGVLLFADHTSWLSPPTTDHASLAASIDRITIGQDGVGYGNLTDPFVATAELDEGDYLVVLTDGVWSNQALAVERARTLHERGVNVVALGFGGADLAFLKRIASAEDLAGMTDLTRLGASFGRIAQVVAEGGGSIAVLP